MFTGGVFDVLIEITKFIENNNTVKFTHSDVVNITGLSESSVTKNLSRLLKQDYITREFYYKDGCQGRFVRYSIKSNNIIRFVNEVLLND